MICPSRNSLQGARDACLCGHEHGRLLKYDQIGRHAAGFMQHEAVALARKQALSSHDDAGQYDQSK